jgi:hypothetical protein
VIVSIHQPQYLPWLPYLSKVAESDLFIILDSVDFQKNGLQNRNQIKTAQGAQWLTVPVHQRLGQKINEVEIDNRANWRRKHWQSIQQNYGKAAAFPGYATALQDTFDREWSSLCELNIHLVGLMMTWAGITTRTVRSSQMMGGGSASTLVLNLCLESRATHYLSGTGAQSYLDEQAFRDAGVEIVYRPAALPTSYPQMHRDAGFIDNLSALDILLNCGSGWRAYLPAAVTAE